MGLFQTLYLPLVLFVSIPLAAFAALTTTLALSTLLIRVAFVYIELGFALLHSSLFTTSSSSKQRARSALLTPQQSSHTPSPPRKSRGRKLSLASSSNGSSADAAGNGSNNTEFKKSGSTLSLYACGTPNRDYEGIGGWRLPGSGDEEALWMGINSRLELPTSAHSGPRSAHGHNNRWSWSPEQVRMSPVQSRVRTPSVGNGEGGVGGASPVEYFTLQPHGRMSSTRVNELLERELGRRRKSGSWESLGSERERERELGGQSRRLSRVSLK